MPSTAKSKTRFPRCPVCERAISLDSLGRFKYHERRGVTFDGRRYVAASVVCRGSGMRP